MQCYTIQGGYPLCGSVIAAGAKNVTLPMMAAALLTDQLVTLIRTPQLTDVLTMGDLLRSLGVSVETKKGLTKKGPGTFCRNGPEGASHKRYPDPFWSSSIITLRTHDERSVRADYELLRKMRAGFCVLGPLLVRRGRAEVAMPGGCSIGDRPVDLHLAALEKLGAKITIEHGYVVAEAEKLTGTTIDMNGKHGSTVTGTIHILSTATLAEGTTTILGAAIEPEVTELGEMLVRMGAKITGLGTSTLQIEGVKSLDGVEHRVIFDRIEAATLLFAAAITAGSVTVCDVVPEMLATPLEMLRRCGCDVTIEEDSVSVFRKGELRPVDIETAPYPGMPTDLQAQWMALMTQAQGSSRIRETVFPSRFMHIAELRRLGADIEYSEGAKKGSGTFCAKHSSGRSGKRYLTPFSAAHVHGPAQLNGADVTATDLRAGAALVMAGLAAEGTTRVFGLDFLNRGYDRLHEKLAQLGAKISEQEVRVT